MRGPLVLLAFLVFPQLHSADVVTSSTKNRIEKNLEALAKVRRSTLQATYFLQAAKEISDLRGELQTRGSLKKARTFTYIRTCGGNGIPRITYFHREELPKDTSYPFLYEDLCDQLIEAEKNWEVKNRSIPYPRPQAELDKALDDFNIKIATLFDQFLAQSDDAIDEILKLAEEEYNKIEITKDPWN
ncbi:MAG: hypothetical protein AB8E15_07940 [Bdellovibrionales bacterium]